MKPHLAPSLARPTAMFAGEPPTYLLKLQLSERGLFISVGLKSMATLPMGITSRGFDISNSTYFIILLLLFLKHLIQRKCYLYSLKLNLSLALTLRQVDKIHLRQQVCLSSYKRTPKISFV